MLHARSGLDGVWYRRKLLVVQLTDTLCFLHVVSIEGTSYYLLTLQCKAVLNPGTQAVLVLAPEVVSC